jgi:putative transposase
MSDQRDLGNGFRSRPACHWPQVPRVTIVDTFSRFSPAVDPRFSYRGEDVVLTLERICKTVGHPKTIRVDQGSEFVLRDLDNWAYQKDVVLDFSRPGKPTDNSFIDPSMASSEANA